VQYVSDGHGGFLEILDDCTQGGAFTVSQLSAQKLQDLLDGSAVPLEGSKMMFSDGVQDEAVAKCALVYH
jgi:hypothetical protein